MYKLDLHTHSIVSHDGGIIENEYKRIIANHILDFVAITDHNKIDFALRLQKELGDSIIVGEEIMTSEGEIIGLFLTSNIDPFQSIEKTIQAIVKQGGIIYVPHPFDKRRSGIGGKNLVKYMKVIDIIEGFNGRIIWHGENKIAKSFAIKNKICWGIGSDAHSIHGLGKTYAKVDGKVTKESIKKLLQKTECVEKYQPIYEYLRPKLNKLKIFFNYEK